MGTQDKYILNLLNSSDSEMRVLGATFLARKSKEEAVRFMEEFGIEEFEFKEEHKIVTKKHLPAVGSMLDYCSISVEAGNGFKVVVGFRVWLEDSISRYVPNKIINLANE